MKEVEIFKASECIHQRIRIYVESGACSDISIKIGDDIDSTYNKLKSAVKHCKSTSVKSSLPALMITAAAGICLLTQDLKMQ